MNERYSLAKISSELGVSKATVSLALSGKARGVGVSKELEKRILDFCRKIDYRPNIHARRTNQKLVKNIGIFLEQMESGATAAILTAIVTRASQRGYRCSIQLRLPEQTEESAFEWLLNREVDGVILYGLALPESWQERIRQEQWPVIGIGVSPETGIPVVNSNNFEATYTLTAGLAKSGYREFHYFSGSPESYPARERERGFREALRDNGVPCPEERIHPGNFFGSTAEKIIAGLLEKKLLSPGSALVCTSDGTAIGVLSALRREGFRVPRDFAVTGVNASDMAAIFSPRITTFEYLPEQQGENAVEMLFDWLESDKRPNSRLLHGKPVPGESAPADCL